MPERPNKRRYEVWDGGTAWADPRLIRDALGDVDARLGAIEEEISRIAAPREIPLPVVDLKPGDQPWVVGNDIKAPRTS